MFKGYKNTVIAIMLACILTMAVGYAILSQQLNVSGTSNISSTWSVKITNITSSATGGATNNTPPEYTDTTAKFDAALVSPGDTMTYDVTVTNAGNLDAILEKVNMTTSNNSAIEFSYSGVAEGEILKAGTSTTLKVVVKYSDSVTSQPGTLDSELIVTLDYKQSTGAGGTISDATDASCFTFDEATGTITHYDYTCGGDIVIPDKINGVTVTTLGSMSFMDPRITSLVLNESLTTIKNSAFNRAVGALDYLIIPSNVTTIEGGAFQYFGSSHDTATIVNTTGRAFDWEAILTGALSLDGSNLAVTGTHNGYPIISSNVTVNIVASGNGNTDSTEGLNFTLLADGYTEPYRGVFASTFDGSTLHIYEANGSEFIFEEEYEDTYEIKFQVEAPLEYACSDNCTATSSIASGRISSLTYKGTNDTHALYELTLVEPRSDLNSTITITMEDGTQFTYNITTDYEIRFCIMDELGQPGICNHEGIEFFD